MARYVSGRSVLPKVCAFVFDVFGTVVDWRSGVAREAAEILGRRAGAKFDPYAFADSWRALYSPAIEEVRSGRRPFTLLDILHLENLRRILPDFGIPSSSLSSEELGQLNTAWHRLDPWPDAREGLTRLKRAYFIAPLSNGNIALLLNMAKTGGLPWDAILGAEVSRAYKPMPEAYLRTVEALGLEPPQVCLVAAHESDLAAAASCGLRTAFVHRPNEFGPDSGASTRPTRRWDVIASDFVDLAHRFGA